MKDKGKMKKIANIFAHLKKNNYIAELSPMRDK